METERSIVSDKEPSLIGMITSPVEQFHRMKEYNPITLPFLVMIIAGILFASSIIYLTPAAELDLGLGKGASAIFTGIVTGIGVVITYLLGALIYKIAMMILSNDTEYGVLLSFSLYVGVISLVGLLVNSILIVLLQGTIEDTYTSLAVLVEKGTALHGILAIFDVFSIWAWIVEIIGLQIVIGLSKKQAIGLVTFFIVLQIIAASISSQISV